MDGKSWVPIDDILERIAEREADCEVIAKAARYRGVNVTAQGINRNYLIWRRWHMGLISLGYVLRQTGAKRIWND